MEHEKKRTPFPSLAPLRIGIDGRSMGQERRGDGRYAFELCRQLDTLLPKAHFFVYSPGPIVLPGKPPRWQLRCSRPPFSLLPPLTWLKMLGWRYCFRDRLDVYWGTNVFLPILPARVHKIITVHDFAYRICPANFPWPHWVANLLFFSWDLNRADRIVAVSRATAQRVHARNGCMPTVISPSVSDEFQIPSQKTIQRCLDRHGIERPYIFNAAAFEPRKNHKRLIETFLQMKRKGELPDHLLVLTGEKGWQHKELSKWLTEEGGSQIKMMGYVPDDDLPSLYAGSDVFVFPSHYEGYGMPVAEARACGTRVVASDIPEIREAGGTGPIYVKPTHQGIRKGILRALDGGGISIAGTTRHRDSWNDGARALAEIFLETAIDGTDTI